MSDPFDYFVLVAEMRTGSNFLETNINAFERLTCYGEAFNPHFIGYPNKTDILGISQSTRDTDPARLISAIKTKTDGLGGFRYFNDHDPRVFDICFSDPRCAKIILTRNPVDSYVSKKIAQATGQWKLTNLNRRKDGMAEFDAAEFTQHFETSRIFQQRLKAALQMNGQTAFFLTYDDLQDIRVINGLAAYLGQKDRLGSLNQSLIRQNPGLLPSKVSNFKEMETVLAEMGYHDLACTPAPEPRRGPGVPSYVAVTKVPLLYLPMRGGPEGVILSWLAELEGVQVDELQTKMNQKELRKWKRKHPGHRSFTVLRHPVARVHAAFCERILATGDGSYSQIRQTLKKHYKLKLPQDVENSGYNSAAHRGVFLAFLEFLRANLVGQTTIRVDATWCTQAQALQGFGDFCLPDHIFREGDLTAQLPALADQIGHSHSLAPRDSMPDRPYALSEIYDSEIESIVSEIYQRDYMMFGFESWAKDQAA